MALFVLRYVSSLLIFALGLKAPGINGNPDGNYRTLNNDGDSRPRFRQNVTHFTLFVHYFYHYLLSLSPTALWQICMYRNYTK